MVPQDLVALMEEEDPVSLVDTVEVFHITNIRQELQEYRITAAVEVNITILQADLQLVVVVVVVCITTLLAQVRDLLLFHLRGDQATLS